MSALFQREDLKEKVKAAVEREKEKQDKLERQLFSTIDDKHKDIKKDIRDQGKAIRMQTQAISEKHDKQHEATTNQLTDASKKHDALLESNAELKAEVSSMKATLQNLVTLTAQKDKEKGPENRAAETEPQTLFGGDEPKMIEEADDATAYSTLSGFTSHEPASKQSTSSKQSSSAATVAESQEIKRLELELKSKKEQLEFILRPHKNPAGVKAQRQEKTERMETADVDHNERMVRARTPLPKRDPANAKVREQDQTKRGKLAEEAHTDRIAKGYAHNARRSRRLLEQNTNR